MVLPGTVKLLHVGMRKGNLVVNVETTEKVIQGSAEVAQPTTGLVRARHRYGPLHSSSRTLMLYLVKIPNVSCCLVHEERQIIDEALIRHLLQRMYGGDAPGVPTAGYLATFPGSISANLPVVI